MITVMDRENNRNANSDMQLCRVLPRTRRPGLHEGEIVQRNVFDKIRFFCFTPMTAQVRQMILQIANQNDIDIAKSKMKCLNAASKHIPKVKSIHQKLT